MTGRNSWCFFTNLFFIKLNLGNMPECEEDWLTYNHCDEYVKSMFYYNERVHCTKLTSRLTKNWKQIIWSIRNWEELGNNKSKLSLDLNYLTICLYKICFLALITLSRLCSFFEIEWIYISFFLYEYERLVFTFLLLFLLQNSKVSTSQQTA